MLRWTASATAAVLLGAGLAGSPSARASVAPANVAAAAATAGIVWSVCADPELAYYGLQCGTLEVPLDRASPDGATVRLALTRKLHTASYQGVMLTNPGGPGGSGLTLPAIGGYVPGGAGAAYDWIGFDPRGVGASTPSLHCVKGYFGENRPSYVPSKAWILRYWVARSRSYAAACASTPAKRALLAHLTTLDTVLDMESIRQALGVERLGYYGFSYGTYLGEVYATRYPTHVGRFVLDGVIDPGRVWYAAGLDQERAFDANMGAYWRYLAAHPQSFHLGRHWQTIKRGYYRTLRRLGRSPAAGGRLGPDELADTMLDAAYYVYDWDSLGRDYSDLVRKRRGGALLSRYREAQAGDDNSYAVYNAVECSDTTWPGLERTRQDAVKMNAVAPFAAWGNTWYAAPCLTWQAPSHVRPAVSGAGLTTTMLLISETRDAATPYSGALATRRLFPSASLVAGVGGTTHASSLSGVACVDTAVASYLRTGTVPTRLSGTRADRSCPRVLPPTPTSDGARAMGPPVDRLSPMLRRDLVQAQRAGR